MTGRHSRESRRRFQLSLIGAFAFGGLLVGGTYLLTKIPDYEGIATIVVGLTVGIVPSLITAIKDGFSAKRAGQSALSFCGGVTVAIGIWVLLFFVTRQEQIPAASYINALDRSNLGVPAFGDAKFSVTIPSGYRELILYLSAADSPGYNDDCSNGAELDITPSYGATVNPTSDIAPGAADPIPVPPGVQDLMISVQFIPQPGFDKCHEDIQAEASSNFSR